MDFSYILNSSLPDYNKLLDYGFLAKNRAENSTVEQTEKKLNKEQNHDVLIYKRKILGGEFYAEIFLDCISGKMTAEVWESSTGEKYALFDVETAHGSFVGQIRSEVLKIIEEICEKCFISTDVKQKYFNFIKARFNTQGDHPFEGDLDTTVCRCPNQKWFALVMKIKYRQLGFAVDVHGGNDGIGRIVGEENVWVVNLKAESELIPKITDKKSIFPAYHMNKKYWITVLLTPVTDFEQLCSLTEKSFELVAGKK